MNFYVSSSICQAHRRDHWDEVKQLQLIKAKGQIYVEAKHKLDM